MLCCRADTDIACQLRYAAIWEFNESVKHVYGLFDPSATSGSWSPLGDLLRALRANVFSTLKLEFVSRAIKKTTSRDGHRRNLTLDHQQAMASESAGHNRPWDSKCTFAQAFHSMGSANPTSFRLALDHRERLFQVSFKNEGGVDWGGVFRDAMSDVRAAVSALPLCADPLPHLTLLAFPDGGRPVR